MPRIRYKEVAGTETKRERLVMIEEKGKKFDNSAKKTVFAVIILIVFQLSVGAVIWVLFGKETAMLSEGPLSLVSMFIFFGLVSKKFRNRMSKGISDDEFPQKTLSVAKELRVIVCDGRWMCPSCNEPSLEIYDTRGNCG